MHSERQSESVSIIRSQIDVKHAPLVCLKFIYKYKNSFGGFLILANIVRERLHSENYLIISENHFFVLIFFNTAKII